MTIKASGRAALILAAGIWIGLSGASQAATSTDSSTAVTVIKQSTHHPRKYAHRKPRKVTNTTANDKKAGAPEETDNPVVGRPATDDPASVQSSQMPASVANANAQLASPDTPAGSAGAITDRADNTLQATPDDAQSTAGTPIVAADQLNDVDRGLHESAPAATPVVLASTDAPAVVANPVAAAASPNSESSIWNQASLIGKIFIGFGTLLIMASTARMLMA
ncbi:MAG: hypothetical protein KGL62_14075 [Bradyrhizobium sp.]|uniref:hypothetical protein n=1 Tax=Bradyrhizobium sp. TaxID=376 RepID=UPI0023A37E97|nr:hypothetical protein [Bradyrhizobium sp.]MDE2603476.1 hypothetical protein [Bradyrhizobium sp.]